jgi:hypothetical protein
MSFIGAGAAIGIGASAAAAIGTGLAVGGVAMGVGSIASGILAKQAADAKQRAYRTMTEWAGGQYQDLGKYQQEQQDKILKSFLENRTTNLAQYKGGYETLISDFDTRFKELETAYSQASAGITSQFREGMGRVRETAAVGRTNTLAAIVCSRHRRLRVSEERPSGSRRSPPSSGRVRSRRALSRSSMQASWLASSRR